MLSRTIYVLPPEAGLVPLWCSKHGFFGVFMKTIYLTIVWKEFVRL